MIKTKDVISKEHEFKKRCSEMLEPLGFVTIYENHPCLPKRQFDYIKQGVRIQFVLEDNQEFFKVCYDVLQKDFTYSITGGTYRITKEKVIEVHTHFVKQKRKFTKIPFYKRLLRKIF